MLLSEIRADRSRYDTGRKRSGSRTKRGGIEYTNMNRPILAIDGEGITDSGGTPENPARHRYVMLAGHCSCNRCPDSFSVSSESLTTSECLDFLLNLPKNHLIVGFSIGYDIAKWLGFIPKRYLEELWKSGSCRWGSYSIRYAPGKQINIRHQDGRRVHIYDVFGYFQRSFVASLEEWNVGTPEQIERIRAMKASRSTFSEESRDEMLAYCLEECQLLVQLIEKLRNALIEGDIPMRAWYGAGAIAAAILEKEGVKKHLERQPPEKYSQAILSAYFGGRFELFESGTHQNVSLYDIRSAYPYILASLPCQTHLVYSDHLGYVPSEYALYHCSWSVPKRTPYPPFPFRESGSRQIFYPTVGKGWYHASEVRAALRLFGDYITIDRSIVIAPMCPPNCARDPFAFIPSYYEYRNVLKQRGSQAQLTLKLGLNSLYGKCAQGVGFGDKKPPFQSYLYAGMITAGTRGMLLDAIAQNPEAIIWTATDGIASKVPLNLPIGGGLGEWEYTQAEWVFAVQAGVYQVCKDGKILVRSRGFGKQETAFDDIKRSYDASPVWGEFRYDTTRFVGLGSALARKDFWGVFGRWKQMSRGIKFYPSKRIPELVLDALEMGLTLRDCEGMTQEPPVRYWPPTGVSGQDESAEYSPKKSWTDQWERESDNDEALDILLDGEQP
jgi:hypothetical protein